MQILLPLSQDCSLTITDQAQAVVAYPTACLMKALLLSRDGLDLAEEAVGFGLPVLKRGLQTFFPSAVALTLIRNEPTVQLNAVYTIDLVEKLTRRGKTGLDLAAFYTLKNLLAGVYRRLPAARGVLAASSNFLRKAFSWQTTYAKSDFSAIVPVTFTFDPRSGFLEIKADFSALPADGRMEAVLMIEQGAVAFDRYRDSSGSVLEGAEIGAWTEVTAQEAGFESPAYRIAFRLRQVQGARLFRGRELSDSRLSWSGFGYSIPSPTGEFTCGVRIETPQ